MHFPLKVEEKKKLIFAGCSVYFFLTTSYPTIATAIMMAIAHPIIVVETWLLIVSKLIGVEVTGTQ
jgi:hypothetical protein